MPAEEKPKEVALTPVAALVTNAKDWRIKARISKLYPVKKWNNPRSQGHLLNFDLVDAAGTAITATCF